MEHLNFKNLLLFSSLSFMSLSTQQEHEQQPADDTTRAIVVAYDQTTKKACCGNNNCGCSKPCQNGAIGAAGAIGATGATGATGALSGNFGDVYQSSLETVGLGAVSFDTNRTLSGNITHTAGSGTINVTTTAAITSYLISYSAFSISTSPVKLQLYVDGVAVTGTIANGINSGIGPNNSIGVNWSGIIQVAAGVHTFEIHNISGASITFDPQGLGGPAAEFSIVQIQP